VAGYICSVLDSDGNSFTVTNAVLDSDGNAFLVSGTVLNSAGVGFVVCTSTETTFLNNAGGQSGEEEQEFIQSDDKILMIFVKQYMKRVL
jgi:hypothetical protein